MNAITLWQPWASWCAAGLKRIETRTHSRFRCLVGLRIAIHGGVHFDEMAIEHAVTIARSYGHRLQEAQIREVANEARQQRGVVVCTAMVTAAKMLTAADAGDALCAIEENRFGLLLSDVELCFHAAQGHQGIWNWEPGAEAKRGQPDGQLSLLP